MSITEAKARLAELLKAFDDSEIALKVTIAEEYGGKSEIVLTQMDKLEVIGEDPETRFTDEQIDKYGLP